MPAKLKASTTRASLELLRNGVEQIRSTTQAYRAERDRLRSEASGPDAVFTAAHSEERVAEARTKALGRILELQESVRAERSDLDELLAESEARVLDELGQRPDFLDARQRVRAMLEKGVTHLDVIRRAEGQRDVLTLRALRAEAAWIDPAARGGGLDPAHGAWTPAQMIRRIDQALLPFLDGDEAVVKTVASEYAQEWPAYEIEVDRAALEIESPNLATTMAIRLAAPQPADEAQDAETVAS